jgi:protein CASC3
LDDERISGDGQEELENGEGKKKVDDDEDRSNPQYIPKKGTFYEHDDRTAEDLDAVQETEVPEVASNSTESQPKDNKVLQLQNVKAQSVKVVKKTKDIADRWTHDRFNENEQAPKSRSELVSAYGYDIRNEDCPPRPRRHRRYGRGQTKYSRNWEDENAYKKAASAKPPSSNPGRKLRPEDFPSLGSSNQSMSQGERRNRRSRHSQDENEPQRYQSRGSGEISSQGRSQRERDSGERMDRGEQKERGRDGSYRDRPSLSENRRYNNDNSNNNNNRSVNGKRNINYRHNTIEFKNQNRNKNINTESGKNNVLQQQQQQQMQHSRNQEPPQSSSQMQNDIPIASISFTNSKMNNASGAGQNQGRPMDNTRNILNFDNSQSLNYGRNSREKEINQMQLQQAMSVQPPALSPNNQKMMGQPLNYGRNSREKEINQMQLQQAMSVQPPALSPNNQKMMGQPYEPVVEKNYQKLNNQLNNVENLNNSEAGRSKRYSSLRQRSALDQTQATPAYHHEPQDTTTLIQPNQTQHIQNVLTSSVQSPATVAYIQQTQTQPPSMIQVKILIVFNKISIILINIHIQFGFCSFRELLNHRNSRNINLPLIMLLIRYVHSNLHFLIFPQ